MLKKKLSLDPLTKMKEKLKPYLTSDMQRIPLSVKKEIKIHEHEFEKLHKKLKTVRFSRTICFALLYVSFLSTFIGDLFIVREIVQLITLLSGIVGSTVLIILIMIFTRLSEIYLSDAHTESAILIALITKYKK